MLTQLLQILCSVGIRWFSIKTRWHLFKTKSFFRPVPYHYHIWDPPIFFLPYLDLYDKYHDSQMPTYCMSHNNILKLEHLHCMFLFQVDLEGLRTVSSDRGRAMAAELGLPYFETSAATGQGDLLQISYSHSVLVFIKHETYLRIIHLSRCWRRCGSIAGPCHGKNREESCQSQVLINQITKLNLCKRIEKNVRPKDNSKWESLIIKISEKSKPRAPVPQPKPGRGLFGFPTQGKWKYLGWTWK